MTIDVSQRKVNRRSVFDSASADGPTVAPNAASA
jgi:hypothetical protein